MLPSGVEGLVGMFRNWTFTLFFCMSELWGDVCLGLLFWGLANDTTTLADAPTLYPLFGLGANVAQALAGTVLKVRCGRVRSCCAATCSWQRRLLLLPLVCAHPHELTMPSMLTTGVQRAGRGPQRHGGVVWQ